MTKTQIITKAMLTTLGIYAAVGLIADLQNIPSRAVYIWLMLAYVLVLAVIVFYIIRLLVLDNDSLVSIILDPREDADEFDRRIYLIKAFRIGFVILGLLLLCSSRMFSGLAFMLRNLSLHSIRIWITDAVNMNFNSPKYLLMHILNIFKLCAAIYLLFGAPHIIRWHLKHSCLNNTEGLTNE